MEPHLVRWANEYAAKGLVVIDIDNGQRDDHDAVAEHAKDLPYRVVRDVDARITKEYAIRGFPAAFLLDVEGKVIWEGFPLPTVDAIELKIQAALEDVAEDKRSDPEAEAAQGD